MRALPMHPHPHLRAFIKWALIVMIVLFAARALHAEVAKIVETKTVPGSSLVGIAWDGSSLWLADNMENLYQLDPATFGIISTCALGGFERYGLTWDGSNIWVAGGALDKIDSSCAILSTFAINHWAFSGVAYGGGYFWAANYNNNFVHKHDYSTGTEMLYWAIPWPGYSHPTGITYDGQNLWIAAGSTVGKFTTSGTKLFSFDTFSDLGLSSGGDTGLAFDSTYLWLSIDNGFNVYKIAVCGAIAFTPASLPGVALNGSYDQSISATGEIGTAPFTFAVTVGSLPTGLTLASDGTFSGAATAAGTYSFTVTATGANTCTATKDYSVIVAGPPSVTTVTPNKGTIDGGTNVTIAGSGIQTGATLTFGGLSATNVVVVSAASITATTPAHVFGAVTVVVTNPDAQTATLTNGFTYEVPMPSVSPCAGPPSGGNDVTFTGNGLSGATAVTFDSTNAPIVTSSGNSITVTAPAHAAGAVAVQMTLPGGNVTFTDAYRYYTPPAAVEWSSAGLNGIDVFALGVSPTSADVVYAGFGTGTGIDKTTNGGGSWTQISSNYGVYAFAIDPTNPNIVYTGKFKSIDAGGTWTTVESGYYHRAVAINPLTTSIVFSGHPYDGIRKSTSSGATWSVVFGSSYIHSLAIDPENPNNVYAAAEDYSSTPGGVYRSTKAGANWTNVLSRTRVNAVALDAAVPSRVYAAVEGEGVYRSEDSAATWTNTNTGLNHLLVRTLIADPTDTNVLYAGTWEGGVYRSTDCGASWTQLNSGLGDTYLVSLATSVADHTIVYASGETGGVYRLATVPPPTITQVTPNKGSSLGGAAVTITGTTLRNATSVTFDGTPASITANTDTSITVTTPAHALGVVDVVVTTTAGSRTAPSAYEFVSGPSIVSIVPSLGATTGGTAVTISGSNFTSGVTVTIGGTSATGVVVSSSTSITATTPAHNAGAADVVVTNPDTITGYLPGGFTYLDPPSVRPCSGPPAGGNSVTLTGTAVLGATAVTFGGLPAAITLSSGNTITVTAPAHAAGGVAIEVTLPGGTFSLANGYRYYTPPLAIEWTRPSTKTDVFDSLAVDWTDVNRVFAASGNAFYYGIQKSTNGTASWTNCSTSNSYAVAIDPTNSNKIYTGYEKSVDGGTTWSSSYGYGPRAVAIDPQTTSILYLGFGGAGIYKSADSGTSWSNLRSSAYVRSLAINPVMTNVIYAGAETNASYTTPGGVHKSVNSGTSWTSVLSNARVNAVAVDPLLPVRVYAAAESGGVYRSDDSGATWTNPNGGLTTTTVRALAVNPNDPNVVYAGTSGGGVFRSADCGETWTAINTGLGDLSPLSLAMSPADSSIVYASGEAGGVYRLAPVPPPLMTLIAPARGTSLGGTTVTITGTTLRNATSVTFGGTAGTITANTDASITVTTPAHALGAVDVVVSTTAGSTTKLAAYEFVTGPSIVAIVPALGATTGGTSVTIAGSNFVTGATVTIGGSAATGVVVSSSTSINATTPPHDAGAADVVVTNPDSVSGLLTGGFTYLDPPAIRPCSGPPAGGNSVTLTGTAVLGATAVTFDGVAARITSGSGNTVTVTAPAHAAGAVAIAITSPGGTFSVSNAYRYYTPPLAVEWTRPSTKTDVFDGLAVDRADVNRLFAASGNAFYGIQKSTNGTASWTNCSTSNSYAVAIDPTDSSKIYTGYEKSVDGGTTWSSSYGYGARAVAIDPQTTSILYLGFGGAGIYKSADSGTSWSNLRSSAYVRSLAINPVMTNVIYAGAETNASYTTPGGVHKSVNSGTSWTSVLANARVNAVLVDPDLPVRVYAATESSGVYRSDDSGTTWSNPNGGLTPTAVRALAINPDDPNVVYAATSGGGVFRSIDCGETWSAINNGLTDLSPLSLGMSPADSSILYAGGGSGGVYRMSTIVPPTLSQIAPASGSTNGGTAVTITGTALDRTTSVTFGAVAATVVSIVNSTTVTATTPSHAAGAVDVVVNSSVALSTTLPNAFTFIDPPSVTSVSPNSALITGGTSVTIAGSHFTTGATVKFANTAATNVVVADASTITATTPAAATPGLVAVTVTNPDGQYSTLAAAFSFLSPPGNQYYVNSAAGSNTTGNGSLAAPWKTIVYSLTKITGFGHTLHAASGSYNAASGETFPILIKNGVSISGAGAGTTIIDAGGSNVVMKAVGISDPGTTVQNFTIRGGGNTREGAGLLITAGSVVKITNNLITENTVSLADITSHYGGGIQVLNASPQIVGNDIRDNIVISGSSTSSPHPNSYGGGIAVSGATSSPTISQNVIANNEARNQSFSNAGGGGIAIVDGATPTITDNTISANSLPRLSATADLNLGGAIYFKAAGGVVSGNTITANTEGLSFGGVVATGAVHVTGASPTIRRNVIAGNQDHGIWCEASAAPLIENNTIASSTLSGIYLASASPSIANNILYANTTFGIEESTTGSDPSSARYNLFFANGSGVYLDEGASGYYDVASLDTAVAECTNNIEGDPLFVNSGGGDYHILSGSVAIDAGDPASELDPDGSRADIGALPYSQASPVINSITPAAGTTAGGTSITIGGANFAAGATVRLGSAIATNVSASDTSITATTASAGAGTVDVVVTNPDGLRGTLAGGFTYVSTPGYTSLAPAVGPAAGGTSVTITGVNLTGTISVTFDGSAGTITANTSTSITVTTPAHAAGTVDVVINAAGGSVSAPAAYTYMAAPTITSVTPNRGPTAGGTSVVIAGTNLAGVTSVVFGGITGTIVSKNATSLTATTPAHAAESSVWRAEAQVTEFTGDGLQGVSIAGARDTQGFPIPSNDTRFGFEIVTSGTSSFELQASGGPGRIDLSWTASTLDTLAGYNLYRSTTSGGPYTTKVNAALLAGTAYSDFTVTPNVPQYYVYRIVNTSLEEASDSNEATATASDADAPVITHTPLTTASGGAPITIVATITDNVPAPPSASVFYRALGSTAAFTQLAMINATGSQYTANIPAGAAVAPGVEYYIEASDGTAISRHGSANGPHVITIATAGGEPGDVTGDGAVDPDDVVFLINYFFGNGPAPGAGGDVDGDGEVTLADLFYLINYLFAGGPPP